jgi:hypothetical protein
MSGTCLRSASSNSDTSEEWAARFAQPVIAFRAWRLDDGRLWSTRERTLETAPSAGLCDISAETRFGPAFDMVTSKACALRGYGLSASYDLGSLEDGDLWAAVLAWGAIVIDDCELRSEWQQPIFVAAAPGSEPSIRSALPQVAAAYGAIPVCADELESAARECGQLIPADEVPVTPLLLLGMYQRSPEPQYDETLRNLAQRAHAGSIAARWQLAGYAADVAMKVASSKGLKDAGSIMRLEAAMTGLAAAIELWTPDPDAAPAKDFRDFRARARATTISALSCARDWQPDPPVTYTWGQIHVLGIALCNAAPPSPVPATAPAPLDEDELLDLMDGVAYRSDLSGEVGDVLFGYLSHHLRGY